MSKDALKVLREKVLSDCPPDKAFWTCHGTIVRNLNELKNTIGGLNDYAFRYHVNSDNSKNDFAVWINDVLEDHDLAKRLNGILDKDRYQKIIEKRIFQLESA
jgi:hypothetical protein